MPRKLVLPAVGGGLIAAGLWFGIPGLQSENTATAPDSTPCSHSSEPGMGGIQEFGIQDMAATETCYTVGWGMWEDLEGHYHLNPDYSVTAVPTGTSHMKIQRNDDDSFTVWVDNDEEEKYSKVEAPSYAGQENAKWLPVAKVIVGP